MTKQQVLEFLEYLEKAQQQKLDRQDEHGVNITKINFPWLIGCVEEYEEKLNERR